MYAQNWPKRKLSQSLPDFTHGLRSWIHNYRVIVTRTRCCIHLYSSLCALMLQLQWLATAGCLVWRRALKHYRCRARAHDFIMFFQLTAHGCPSLFVLVPPKAVFNANTHLLLKPLSVTGLLSALRSAWRIVTQCQKCYTGLLFAFFALCFSSSVIFLLVDACVGLNWLLVSFLSHVNKNIIHSFIHS